MRGRQSHFIEVTKEFIFYGTYYEIWACFGPVGNTEKNGGLIMSNFLGQFFLFFHGQKKLTFKRKHYRVYTKKVE